MDGGLSRLWENRPLQPDYLLESRESESDRVSASANNELPFNKLRLVLALIQSGVQMNRAGPSGTRFTLQNRMMSLRAAISCSVEQNPQNPPDFPSAPAPRSPTRTKERLRFDSRSVPAAEQTLHRGHTTIYRHHRNGPEQCPVLTSCCSGSEPLNFRTSSSVCRNEAPL